MQSFKDFMFEDAGGMTGAKLQMLWKKFLKDAEVMGYVPRPNITIGFRDKNLSQHDISGFVELETPSRKELGIMRTKERPNRKMERDPYYNTIRQKLKEMVEVPDAK